MTEGNIHLTHEGYEKIRKKLERLKTAKRKKLSKAIAAARAHGDISENAEYDAAKEAMALNEKKIAELEAKLSRVQILDDTRIAKDEALIGAQHTHANVIYSSMHVHLSERDCLEAIAVKGEAQKIRKLNIKIMLFQLLAHPKLT